MTILLSVDEPIKAFRFSVYIIVMLVGNCPGFYFCFFKRVDFDCFILCFIHLRTKLEIFIHKSYFKRVHNQFLIKNQFKTI